MEAKRAYEMVCETVEAHPRRRLVDAFFDEERFGSFLVSFEEGGEERCVVNDRGFLFLSADLDGSGDSIATVTSLEDVDRKALLKGLNL
jgi:hypothetical protein